jgi:hypothetical protein
VRASIYALNDSAGNVRYVGKTIKKTSYRLAAHIKEARNGSKTHKSKWIRKCLVNGYVPTLTVLEVVEGDGLDAERSWIGRLKQQGARLTNGTDGGEGMVGYRHSSEARARIGIANKGRKRSPEEVERIRKMHQGKALSIEHRHKLSLALAGRMFSDETKAKISAAKMGFRHSAESKSKMSMARLGTKASSETIEKVRQSAIAREVRKRMQKEMGSPVQ